MKRLPAYPLSIGMSAVDGLAVATVITTSLVYQVETVGLNALQLVLVGTVLEATIFAFEIPTGVVADVYSRRLSVVIGLALTGAGFLLAGSVPLFGALLAASVVGGLGATFLSGARTAWLADEIGAERLPHALMRGSQASLAGGLAGAALSVALASVDRSWPLVAGGSMFLALALFSAFAMTEHGFRPLPAPERQTFRTMGRTLRQALGVIRRRRVLVLIVMAPFLFGASSEVPDRLTTPFLLETITLPPLGPLDPVAWFGLSSYVTMALGFALLEVVRRTVNTADDRAVAATLFVLQGLYVASLVAFGLAAEFRLRHGHVLGPGTVAPRQRSPAERLAEPLRALPRPGHGPLLRRADGRRGPDDRRTAAGRRRPGPVAARRVRGRGGGAAAGGDRLRRDGGDSPAGGVVKL